MTTPIEKPLLAIATALALYLGAQAAGSHGEVQLWEGGPYWAATNIGAKNPEDYGYYFWWGDTVGYKRVNDVWVATDGSSSGYSFRSAPTCNKRPRDLKNEGWIVKPGVLAPEHDAAHVHWGGDWRMPTDTELAALNSNCDWTWTTRNGVKGYIVRGRDDFAGNSIFLPCAGLGGFKGASIAQAGDAGCYWSAVPSSGNYSHYSSWFINIHAGGHYIFDNSRNLGQSIRPVRGLAKAKKPAKVSREESGSSAAASSKLALHYSGSAVDEHELAQMVGTSVKESISVNALCQQYEDERAERPQACEE